MRKYQFYQNHQNFFVLKLGLWEKFIKTKNQAVALFVNRTNTAGRQRKSRTKKSYQEDLIESLKNPKELPN